MMGVKTAFDQTIEQMTALEIQRNPALADFREVLERFFAQHMSYESMKPDLIRIYAETFTAGELAEIQDFYRTPTGQKTLKEMPTLTSRGAQLGAQRVQQNLPELEQMLRVRAEELKQQAANGQ